VRIALTEFRELRICLFLPILLCASPRTLCSQSGASPQTNPRQVGVQEPFRTAQASRLDRDPKMDGTLDDPLWQQATPITNFLQREPYEGQAPTEQTEVRILYTKHEVYFGVVCHDSLVDGPVATQLRRDVTQELDDHFEIIIDSRRDRRNAYVFQVNPLGTQRDALITDEQAGDTQDGDPGWDGVWTSEARITRDGWTATIAIPFSTLNFMQSRDVVWGVNFKRFIRRKNEEDLWSGWRRTFGAKPDQPSGGVAWDQRYRQWASVHRQALSPRRLQSPACQRNRKWSDSGHDWSVHGWRRHQGWTPFQSRGESHGEYGLRG